MTLLFLFILPNVLSWILPHNFKQAIQDNNTFLGHGNYGEVKQFTIDKRQFAVKVQPITDDSVFDVTVLLFASSHSARHIISPVLVSITNDELVIGMIKMLADAWFVRDPDHILSINEQLARAAIGEHTMIDRLLGLAELHKIGFAHTDLHEANLLLDTNGDAFLTDFGKAVFVSAVQMENLSDYTKMFPKSKEAINADNNVLRSSLALMSVICEENKARKSIYWEEIDWYLSEQNRESKTTVGIANLLKEWLDDETR